MADDTTPAAGTSEAAIKSLSRALDEMQEKAKQLEESLKSVNSGSTAPLAATVSSGTQKSSGDMASGALAKMLRQELGAGIASLFSGGGSGAAASNLSVIIQNNSGANVSAAQGTDGFDQKTLEITIDQMVANSLLRGRETSGVLRTLFGLVPTLIGR